MKGMNSEAKDFRRIERMIELERKRRTLSKEEALRQAGCGFYISWVLLQISYGD